jgi:hypothetical protein
LVAKKRVFVVAFLHKHDSDVIFCCRHALMTVATAADPDIERFLMQLQRIAVLSLQFVDDTRCIQYFTMKLKV